MLADPEQIIERVSDWAVATASIEALLLFGSRSRDNSNIAGRDVHSDIDFQIVTYQPEVFLNDSWLRVLGVCRPVAYVYREASGGVSKATALFEGGAELDVVVIPALRMRVARCVVLWGLHRRFVSLAMPLNELSTVLGGGYKMLKGSRRWQQFYAIVVSEIRGARISDLEVMKMADDFLCDYNWINKKIHRGEFIAAQRMLHRSLVENNFKLLHECRVRRSMLSYRDARRIEFICNDDEIQMISVESKLAKDSLLKTSRKCASALQKLVFELVGNRWKWPPEIPF